MYAGDIRPAAEQLPATLPCKATGDGRTFYPDMWSNRIAGRSATSPNFTPAGGGRGSRTRSEARSSKPEALSYHYSGEAFMDLDDFRRFFAYDSWANQEVLASFHGVGTPPVRSLSLLAHILGTEYVWYSRLNRQTSPVAVWPELSVSNCEQHVIALQQIWSDYLDELQ